MIPSQVKSVLPLGAKLVRKTKTTRGETFVFHHTVGQCIVDGDRLVVKVTRGLSSVTVTEKIWDDSLTPPPGPIKKPERKAQPVLINPDDPFYLWNEGQKPLPRAPCFLIQHKSVLKILDVDGNQIGRGTPVPGVSQS